MLQTFARTMGHDLRTPLQALVFSLHMCEASIRSMMTREDAMALERVRQASSCAEHGPMALERVRQASSCAELLSLIVSNLWELDSLENPRAAAGRQKVLLPNEHLERMDLRSRLVSIVELLKSSPQTKPHVLLQLVADERLPLVMCDASRLTRALLNLMVNSLKFTSSGVVTLAMTLLDDDGHVASIRFEVSDTGRGMAKEEIARVAEAYVCSPAEEDGGMGLGLAIVTQAVHSLGGQLTITSPGRGHGSSSVFTLRLQHAPPEDPEALMAARDEVPMRVLLANDVEIILSGAKSILEDLGHVVVHTASDGEEPARSCSACSCSTLTR